MASQGIENPVTSTTPAATVPVTTLYPTSTPYVTSTLPDTTSTQSQPATLATAPSTASQSPASSSSSPTSGISTGAIAGAVVAAAIGGALLAFLLTFLLMRSRSRKPNKDVREVKQRGNSKSPEYAVEEVSADITPGKDQWEKHLPQSADDNTLRLNVKTLLHQIELHVETFYTTPASPIKISEDLKSQLMKIDSQHLPQSIVPMLSQVQDQTLLIKHCLAQMILSNITGEGANPESFLPPDFICLLQAMQMERRKSSKLAFNQALSRWRVLTSYLRPNTTDDQAYISCRDSNIQAAADTFCTSFGLWANPRYHSPARHQHLTQIMKAAAETGILIFSQPSTFAYLWTVPASARRSGVSFVVMPGFAKVADEKAQALEKPYIMVPQVLHGY